MIYTWKVVHPIISIPLTTKCWPEINAETMRFYAMWGYLLISLCLRPPQGSLYLSLHQYQYKANLILPLSPFSTSSIRKMTLRYLPARLFEFYVLGNTYIMERNKSIRSYWKFCMWFLLVERNATSVCPSFCLSNQNFRFIFLVTGDSRYQTVAARNHGIHVQTDNYRTVKLNLEFNNSSFLRVATHFGH